MLEVRAYLLVLIGSRHRLHNTVAEPLTARASRLETACSTSSNP